MSETSTWGFALPDDGTTSWGNAYRSAMTTIDLRLFGARGSFFAEDQSAETVIDTQNVAVKANIATTEGPPCQFCNYPVPNRLTYAGALTRVVTVWTSAAITSSNNQIIEVGVRRNGLEIAGLKTLVRTGTVGGGNATVVGHVQIATNDFLEVWVKNRSSAANVVFTDITLAVRG